MATVKELQLSRKTTHGDSTERLYSVQNTADVAAAITAVLAVAPATLTINDVTYYRGAPEVSPIFVNEGANFGQWEVRFTYKTIIWSPKQPQEYDSNFAFDTTGGTQHITQSLQTINSYGSNGNYATDHKGAIGFDGDTVQGVDITVPVFKFSETHYLPASKVTDNWKASIMELTGKVSDSSFRGFAAGEVLFLGASGTRRGRNSDDMWEITFNFAVSKNKTGITIGTITGIEKQGWEYVWVEYETAVDTNSKGKCKTPKSVYVECVYDKATFSSLIPTRSV